MNTHCAGCRPIENRMDSRGAPYCLEPIVFPSSLSRFSAPRLHPSYQCLGCDRIWIFDEELGYQSESSLRQAA